MRIAFVGDIALFGRNSLSSCTDLKTKFGTLKILFDSCDYVVGNLETPLTSENMTIGGKSAYIKGNTSDVEILKYIGISAVSLANNHMFDYGRNGLNETIEVLEKNGIEWFGAYGKGGLIKRDNNAIALHGYCCLSANGRGLLNSEKAINLLNPEIVERDISQDEKLHRFPVISFHWGDEHIHYPRYEHILLARYFANNYRILMPCHHPHVIQGIERIEQSLVAYSLGNFCFDDLYTNKSKRPLVELKDYNREILILIVEVVNNEIVEYELKPYVFSDYEYQPEDRLLDYIKEWSSFLYEDENTYKRYRDELLNKYLDSRKSARDIEWYIKRLNVDSYKMIKNARRNNAEYHKYIIDYLRNKELIS